MKLCGIDLHSNNSVVVVTDGNDRILASRRCPNDLSKILHVLEPHRGELQGVVIESTYTGTGWSTACRRRAMSCTWPTPSP